MHGAGPPHACEPPQAGLPPGAVADESAGDPAAADVGPHPGVGPGDDAVWRALGSPVRRRILDLLRAVPRTTGALAREFPELSRFAVMQHLGVLADADLVVTVREGRERWNHLNPVPIHRVLSRWVSRFDGEFSAALTGLRRAAESPDPSRPRSRRTRPRPAPRPDAGAQGAARAALRTRRIPEPREEPPAPRTRPCEPICPSVAEFARAGAGPDGLCGKPSAPSAESAAAATDEGVTT